MLGDECEHVLKSDLPERLTGCRPVSDVVSPLGDCNVNEGVRSGQIGYVDGIRLTLSHASIAL